MELNTFFKIDDDLELRAFEDEDAPQVFERAQANYERLHPFLHWMTEDYSPESAKEFIERTQQAAAEKTSQALAIFYREKFIGAIGFVKFSWNSRSTEIGYWIDRDFEGKGIIIRASKLLIEYAFDHLNMNRIEIRCATENTRSRAVPERLGFTLEGILRQSQWRHTRFLDIAIYGMLLEQWSVVGGRWSEENLETVSDRFALLTDH